MKSSENWSSFYNNDYKSNNYYPENFVQRIFTSTKPIQFLDRNYNGKRILDLGCGHGRNIPFLISLGFKVYGLEISNRLIKRLETTFPEQKFMNGLASEIPFENDYFDYVLACNSIYYVDDIKNGMKNNFKEVRRILKQNGKFIVSLLGSKHNIFNKAIRIRRNYYLIKNDFLEFRNGLTIFSIDHSDDLNNYLSGFEYLYHGEIQEKVSDYNRHLFYFILNKIENE